MERRDPLLNMQEFFMKENISSTNVRIVSKYLESLVAKQLKPASIDYNVRVMQFTLRHIRTDLDKLTVDDMDTFQAALATWKRERLEPGKPVADSTKKQYIIGLKRFLIWYSKRYGKAEYRNLGDNIDMKLSPKKKLPSDLLTVDEVGKMIEVADNAMDKAFLASLYESGCRIGEISSCRIKDAVPGIDGFELTFPEGKTGSRTVLLVYAKNWLRIWFELHPLRDNPEAPLWVVKRQQNTGTKDDPVYEWVRPVQQVLYAMVKQTAKKAGIQKRVHPHLFRHSRATELASKWTEQEMKAFLGWAPGSNMVARYAHLSAEDMKDSVREMYGLVDVKKSKTGLDDMIRCNGCSELVPVGSRHCLRCGYPLTEEAKSQVDKDFNRIMEWISSHPEKLSEAIKRASK